MRILVTRPEPDARIFAEKLEELGHEGVVAPLLSVKFSRGQIPLNDVQALVVTSRNALRALSRSPSLTKAVALPVFTVGPGSGEMAAELGFERIVAGPASARDLVPVIAARGEPTGRPLLVLSGDRPAFDIKTALEAHGFKVNEKTVYRSVPAGPLSPKIVQDMRQGRIDGVVLMSPMTAEVFVSLTDEAGLGDVTRHLHYFCISPAVAQRLGSATPYNLHVAAKPTSEEVLALVARMAAKSH